MSERRQRGVVVHARSATNPAQTACKRTLGHGLYALTATLRQNAARINCKQCLRMIGRPLLDVLAEHDGEEV